MKPSNQPRNHSRDGERVFVDEREFNRVPRRTAINDDQFTSSLLGRFEDLSGFFHAWNWTRPRLYLLRSAPALACIVVLAALALSALMVPQSRLVPRYKHAANTALRKNDTELAETMYRKVLAIAPADHESQYGLALIAFEKDDQNRAFRLMRKLALETQFGPAHFWLASNMVDKSKQAPLTRPEQTLLGFHLRQASIHDAQNQDASFLMAHYSYDSGVYAEAIRHFQRSFTKHPEARLLLHDAYQKQGMLEQATETIQHAEEFYQQQAARRPTDVKNRLLWAQTVSMRGDNAAAMNILEEGVVLQPGEVDYRRALTSLYLKRSDQLMAQSSQQTGMRFLHQAIMVSPESEQALERLLKQAVGTGHTRNSARSILREIDSKLRPTAIFNQTLARMALADDDMATASLHFRRALKLDPTNYRTANNLAWTLARQEPPQLEEALLIAGQAAELSSEDEDYAAVMDTQQDIVNRMTGRSRSMIARGQKKPAIH